MPVINLLPLNLKCIILWALQTFFFSQLMILSFANQGCWKDTRNPEREKGTLLLPVLILPLEPGNWPAGALTTLPTVAAPLSTLATS